MRFTAFCCKEFTLGLVILYMVEGIIFADTIRGGNDFQKQKKANDIICHGQKTQKVLTDVVLTLM